MKPILRNLQLILLSGTILVIDTSFPTCENILGAPGQPPNCHYCYTERIRDRCGDQCNTNKCFEKTASDFTTTAISGTSGGSGGEGTLCNNIDPCVKMDDANRQFQKRCKAKDITSQCASYCRYNVTKREIQEVFMRGDCDISQARDFLYAASNNKNNGYCCRKKHLLDGPKSVCEPFCNPDSDAWPSKASTKYLRCLGLFDNILQCHWASCRY